MGFSERRVTAAAWPAMLLLLLLPLLATSSLLVPSLCGDLECNLVCEPDQVCLPTGTNCIMAPCCEAWQCGGQQKQPGTCPPEWPDMSESCHSGTHCEYGLKVCCGEEVPDVVFDCDGQGHWEMYYVDTVCDLGLPCP